MLAAPSASDRPHPSLIWIEDGHITSRTPLSYFAYALIRKKMIFSSYIRKFRMKQLQSHIWLTASSYMGNICAFPHILGSPTSISLYFEENLIFFFISALSLKRKKNSRKILLFYVFLLWTIADQCSKMI